jgi:Flp pilus assembly protein TadG
MFHGIMKKINTKLNRRGQSLAETAITLPILIMLISGLIDIGRLYFMYIALNDAAGEAAIYMSINPNCWDDTLAACAAPNNADYRAKSTGGGANFIDWSQVTLTLTEGANSSTATCASGEIDLGDAIIVTIQYPAQLLTPFIQGLAAVNPLTLRTAAAATVIITPDPACPAY